LFLSKPNAAEVMAGFIPTIDNESLFVALGMLGATVMPHNFYLHSSVVQSRKFGRNPSQIKQACLYNLLDSTFALNIAFFVNMAILMGKF
jgi:manganese transport protein